ncbi:lipid-A-disaccharide synthase [Galbibacter mesophilus]|uniref:lipid-A-disaccharide synthase n=1 Tax=Galbibacter mesophilus TaxID=379069 RepID=UPI00191EB2E5|nr:lipid-A-disaccharide synthase [Galbibacter mesophilus]MCM5662640.1 lipid-A-disaccharide synthase [Galbibacter mesophilus]
MRYYIIAGEASGDLHASNLIKELKKVDENASFRGWGGDLMQAAGLELVKHYKEQSFMGFFEVVMNLRAIFSNIKFCKEDIEAYQPDVLIFIDYSGFNLRIAKWAKEKNYRTFYYVSPQIWASREKRIEAIKRDIDEMFVILPFEKDFYEKKHNYPVNFVGHPLLDAIGNRKQVLPNDFKKENGLDEREIIALLPGSRKQEITNMLSVMLSVVDDFKEYQFVIAGAPSQDYHFYEQFIGKHNVHFVTGKTYDLLSVSKAALVTSGTATLETALFKVPEVVCYKGNWISYQIAKRIITLKYISLVNLIMDKEVVKELIQNDLTTKNLKRELKKILSPEIRERIFLDYFELEKKLGGKGASKKTAELIFNKIS